MILPDFANFLPRNDTNCKDFVKKSAIIKTISFLDYRPHFEVIVFLVAPSASLNVWNWHRIGIALMQHDLYKNYWTVKAEKHSNFHSFCLFKQKRAIFYTKGI